MKKVIVFALVLTIHGVLLSSVLAQQTPRYLVTHVNSLETPSTGAPRIATVVTVVNQSSVSCDVQVEWFSAGAASSSLVCTGQGTVVPGGVLQFCSRNLPSGVSGGGCNDFCDPGQTGFFFGKAIVSSSERSECSLLGIEARVLFTGVNDNQILAISNSKVVFFGEGNLGD